MNRSGWSNYATERLWEEYFENFAKCGIRMTANDCEDAVLDYINAITNKEWPVRDWAYRFVMEANWSELATAIGQHIDAASAPVALS
jgi:hypothetical protein